MFSNFKVHHCVHTISNHCPLLLNTKYNNSVYMNQQQCFKFEAAWVLNESYEEVKRLWLQLAGVVPDQTRFVGQGLMRWAKGK